MGIKDFDVFVIGSGVSGRYVARTCAKKGLEVAIADNRRYGGICANRGCTPKKVLLGPTEVYELAFNLKDKGIAELPELDWKKIQKFKRKFTDSVPAATESNLSDLGIKLYHQSPKFLDTNTLSVEGKTVNAKKIVIATGRIPRKLNIKGAMFLSTSDDFLRLKKLPKSMVFIGAGYIGMEFAHMAARNGSKVTVLEKNDSILHAFDRDLVSELINASKKLGIRFICNTEILRVEKLRKNYAIHYNEKGKEKTLKARMVFNTSGRVPAIDELVLEKGKVTYSERGITVNEYLQNTTNPDVYACGDVAAHSLPLAPLSGIEAKVVAENIIAGNQKKIETPVVPSVIFTLPNLASVGLLEEASKRKYDNVLVHYKSVSDWYNARRINAQTYAFKVLINQRTKQILGAHILGPHAAETINLFAMAINQKMTVEEIKHTIFTYPSWANDIKSML